MIIVEDADRMTEACRRTLLLKMIEEPPARRGPALRAASLHPDDVPVMIRSRCRLVGLRTPAGGTNIADVLVRRDGVDPALAAWSAAASGGHVGRAWGLARDEDARLACKAVLDVPLSLVSLAACLDAADDLVGSAEEETDAATSVLDGAETEAVKASLGFGARGPGVAASRGGAGAAKGSSGSRSPGPPGSAATRSTGRWSTSPASTATPWCCIGRRGPADADAPDRRADAEELARRIGAEGALRRIDATWACRLAIEQNVKPRIALEALTVALRLPAYPHPRRYGDRGVVRCPGSPPP